MVKGRKIIHVDMDAFYASVEQLDTPELAGRAVIVGGSGRRGVVSAASYEARKFGVHSAMPMAEAIKLCPQAVILPVRMERYVEISQEIHTIFEHFTPLVESVSLDEAFLDVTDSIGLFGSAEQIGRTIKSTIKQKTGLTASVGVASNKLLAKLASELEKPDGFVVITEANKQKILDPLPVSKIPGVGKVTQKTLHDRGIYKVAQLRGKTVEQLTGIVGGFAPTLLQFANGIDSSEVEPLREHKSMSSEQTFEVDTNDEKVLLNTILGQVEQVAQRLRIHKLTAKTVTLKFRYGDFTTITRSRKLKDASNTTETLWQMSKNIFRQWYGQSRGALRLIGFEASGLTKEDAGQRLLFEDIETKKQKRLDEAVDKIRQKYGDDSVQRRH